MFIGQSASISWFDYIHLGEGLFALVGWPNKMLSNEGLLIALWRHIRLTLVDFQLDAQNSYLFTYNTFIKLLYMFRALPCSSSEGLCRNCIYAASGIVTLCRWLSCALVKKELNRCTGQPPAESDDTRGCIYTHLHEVYVVIVYMQPLVLLLSAGDCLVHRLRKN